MYRFLVIATDGVWDHLSDQEVINIVKQSNNNSNEASKNIIEQTLLRSAEKSKMTVNELKSLPPGRARRSRHDDTTAIVMYF